MKNLAEIGRLQVVLQWTLRVLALYLAVASPGAALADDSLHAGPIDGSLKQRLSACTSCHGEHGEGSADSQFFPRLAGKPADYLARQLHYFQDGQRKYAPMQNIVQQLDPAYLKEMADYFSAQQVPYRRSAIPTLPATTLQRGRLLVSEGDPTLGVPACTSCHGQGLTGVEPDIPALVGLPYDYVSSQLGSWRTGTRAAAAPDCMAEIANRLAPGDITAVSAWLASLQPPADAHAQAPATIKPPLACGVLGAREGGA